MGFLMSNNAIDVCDYVLYGENVFACFECRYALMEGVVSLSKGDCDATMKSSVGKGPRLCRLQSFGRYVVVNGPQEW